MIEIVRYLVCETCTVILERLYSDDVIWKVRMKYQFFLVFKYNKVEF